MTLEEATRLARAAAAKRDIVLSKSALAFCIGKETTTCYFEGKMQGKQPSDSRHVGKWYLKFTREGEEGMFGELFSFWIDDQTGEVEWNEPPPPPTIWMRILYRLSDAAGMLLALPFLPLFWLVCGVMDVIDKISARIRIARTPDCPRCGKPVRTPKAQQCFNCGLDWHHRPRPTPTTIEHPQ